jgi:hypothetical protein
MEEMEQKQFDDLCTLYESSLRLLRNPTCEKCEAKVRNPLSVWHVGKSFHRSAIRVLFVGKPHRGTPGLIRPSGLIDPRKRVEELKEVSWAYWSYTREIGKKLFPGENDG